jgi:hypothetical protein
MYVSMYLLVYMYVCLPVFFCVSWPCQSCLLSIYLLLLIILQSCVQPYVCISISLSEYYTQHNQSNTARRRAQPLCRVLFPRAVKCTQTSATSQRVSQKAKSTHCKVSTKAGFVSARSTSSNVWPPSMSKARSVAPWNQDCLHVLPRISPHNIAHGGDFVFIDLVPSANESNAHSSTPDTGISDVPHPSKVLWVSTSPLNSMSTAGVGHKRATGVTCSLSRSIDDRELRCTDRIWIEQTFACANDTTTRPSNRPLRETVTPATQPFIYFDS